jgi:hypothetical protein
MNAVWIDIPHPYENPPKNNLLASPFKISTSLFTNFSIIFKLSFISSLEKASSNGLSKLLS